jgi:hypothetical protein
MTFRRTGLVAFALAAVVQTSFVAIYGAITAWCFCAINGAPDLPRVPYFLVSYLDALMLVQRLGFELQVGNLSSALVSAALNSVAWAVLFFLILGPLNLLRRSGIPM